MHTNENKKEKPAGQWGGFTTGRGMIVFILPSNAPNTQRLPSRFASITSIAASAFTPFHAAFCQPATFMPSALMPAFQHCRSVSHAAPPMPPREVFTCTHMYPTGVSLSSVVWRIPPPWDHVCIAFNLGRLGGVGVACRRGGLSNTALSTTRRRRFPVIKSHAGMARGLLVRRL